MTYWGDSLFLQSIGWAILNSFWQMALLWCLFQLGSHFIKLSSNRKYLFAVYSVFLGFVWFIATLVSYYSSGLNHSTVSTLAVEVSATQLSVILSAASVAYLSLLIFPTYRIIYNWKSLKQIKKGNLQKAAYRYRLFTQKIASHLGISKPVKVYVSQWITSPLTVGFLKPLILLPVSAVTNLTTQQLEAILLHELSHIKRQDYIINICLSIVQTVLYFNPFIKHFMKRIEIERENCCDELVLQFEYDRHSYAAALLQLEKNAQSVPVFAMAAAQKNHLLHRIEKIVGVNRKPSFNTTHFAGAFAVVLMLLVINSVLIARKERVAENSVNHYADHFTFFTNNKEEKPGEPKKDEPALFLATIGKSDPSKTTTPEISESIDYQYIPSAPPVPSAPLPDPAFIQVALDESEVKLNAAQKQQVGNTIQATRKVLEKNWKEIEKSIGDGMTASEKALAKQQYLKEVEKIDWKTLEKSLKTQYEQINWDELNTSLAQSLVMAEIDSVQEVYTKVAAELNKMKATETCTKTVVAMPDASVEQVEKAKAAVNQKLAEIQKLKSKKPVVRL